LSGKSTRFAKRVTVPGICRPPPEGPSASLVRLPMTRFSARPAAAMGSGRTFTVKPSIRSAQGPGPWAV
jgi:hypothetical protein